MIGIYKITNLINNRCYIGQSRNIQKRWTDHKNTAFNSNKDGYDYPLYKSIRKYGLENFLFEVIEECSISSLNERENYWIKFYSATDKQKGYNQSLDAFNHHSFLLSEEDVKNITNELIFSIEKLEKEIAEKYGVSIHTIKDINVGRTWKREELNYPLRKPIAEQKFFCEECGKEVWKGNNRCRECADKAKRLVERPDKETLYQLLKENSFCAVGRMYSVSDNAIRKWCKAYGLPTRAKDYKMPD